MDLVREFFNLPNETQVDVLQFFDKRVRKTDACWYWTGARNPNGYGNVNKLIDGQLAWASAHRFSFLINVGEIPEGKMVCHHCDTRHCVRPDHLFSGSALDNMRDKIEKGRDRILVGEQAPGAKLTRKQVLSIKNHLESDVSQAELARRYNVSASCISYIAKGLTWKHL